MVVVDEVLHADQEHVYSAQSTTVSPEGVRDRSGQNGNVDFYPLRHLLPSLLACIVGLVET